MPNLQGKKTAPVIGANEFNDNLDQTKKYRIVVYSDESVVGDVISWANKKGVHPFKKSASSKAFEFKLPKDKLDSFVQSAAFQHIVSVLAANGFALTPRWFKDRVLESTESSYSSKDSNENLDMSMDKLMNDMLDHFEGKINDPMVEKLLSQMHMFDPNTGEWKDVYKYLKDYGIKTIDNAKRVCAMWRNAGRPGVPQYVATRVQWREFNRYVVPNATKLVMSTPNDQEVQDRDKTITDNNLTMQQYRGNAHIRRVAGSTYVDHGGKKDNFHGTYVYDISDTEVFPGMEDLFNTNEGLASNLWQDQYNAKAMQDMGDSKVDNDAIEQAGFTNNQSAQEKIMSALKQWSADNPNISGKVQRALNENDVVGAIRGCLETESYIDRGERNPTVKESIISMCLFAILNHYGIAPANMLQSFQRARAYLMNNKQIPKEVRVKFMPFYANFVHMVETYSQKAAVKESKKIRGEFVGLWNRLVEINDRDKWTSVE